MAESVNGGVRDPRKTFLEVYSHLKQELLQDPAFDFTEDSRQWVDRMLDYNVPGGKLNRGLSVVDSYKLLKVGKELSEEELFLACALGWCIEWLQAYFLVLDDIMDNSHTRRGQPCWFRVPKVGLIACNDGIILRNHIFRILKKHFRAKPYYVDLLDLFNEVEFQTTSGQMLDLITTLEGEKDLAKYKLPVYVLKMCQSIETRTLFPYSVIGPADSSPLHNGVRCYLHPSGPLGLIIVLPGFNILLTKRKNLQGSHRRIVQYKTAYYSFYLPVACALLMSGENLDNFIGVKNILVEMGTYFQVQDDYLDCFGDPEIIGKIGTDIEDFKCSWLVVQALECADENQKKILYENYGKADPACVARVKALYKELNLPAVFLKYERSSYEELISSIEAQPSIAVQGVLKSFLAKIYKREK